MRRLETTVSWLRELLPEGIVVPSSTLISGPGGTGKPLVEFAFVAEWLKSGGNLIGIPLQYPSGEMVKSAMKKLYGLDLNRYHGRICYVQFDPGIRGCEKTAADTLKANMVIPEVWDETIDRAMDMLESSDKGIMIFGSALNLLLFSKRYKDIVLNKLTQLIRYDKKYTYLFAVSTSALPHDIRILEEAADNLMFTRMKEPMRLYLKLTRIKDVKFSEEEIEVPISPEMLQEISKIAESTRKTRIPMIKKM